MQKSAHSTRQRLFCQSLKDAREAAGLTQTRLAKRLGEPQSFVSRFERGERRLDVMEYVEVMTAIGMDPVVHLRKVLKMLRSKTASDRRLGNAS